MKPFAFFRRASATAAVAPLPIPNSFHQQLKPLLHDLLSQLPSSSSDQSATLPSSAWFLHALHGSITAQTIALDSLKAIAFRHSDRTLVEKYLEDNVTALDACNHLSEKMEIIQEYVKSLRVVSRLLQGNVDPKPTTLARALDLLRSSSEAMERRFGEILNHKCNSRSSLRTMSSEKVAHQQDFTEHGEILNGSMAVASMVCGILGTALSFKSKVSKRLERLLPTTFIERSDQSILTSLHEFNKQFKGRKAGKNSCMMLSELEQTVTVARDLQNHIRLRNKSELKVIAEELKSRCDGLEEKITALEAGVRDLYKHLISIRMALLGTLSRA